MQAELEKWLSKHTDEMEHTDRQGTIIGYTEVVTVTDLRALLAGKVLCDGIAVDCHECSGDGYHWGSVNRVNKRIGCVTCNETGKLYAPADIGKEGA